jgi:hypothetical protein
MDGFVVVAEASNERLAGGKDSRADAERIAADLVKRF